MFRRSLLCTLFLVSNVYSQAIDIPDSFTVPVNRMRIIRGDTDGKYITFLNLDADLDLIQINEKACIVLPTVAKKYTIVALTAKDSNISHKYITIDATGGVRPDPRPEPKPEPTPPTPEPEPKPAVGISWIIAMVNQAVDDTPTAEALASDRFRKRLQAANIKFRIYGPDSAEAKEKGYTNLVTEYPALIILDRQNKHLRTIKVPQGEKAILEFLDSLGIK